MSNSTIHQDSLVLYKSYAAHIKQKVDDNKLEIEYGNGKNLKVRYKDVTLLHPGPVESLDDLVPPTEGEVKVAWELLAGRTTTLPDLADLIYGEYTPATAWATWQLIEDGLYFRGSPKLVVAQSVEEVAEEEAIRDAKAAEEKAWNEFVDRVRRQKFLPEDAGYLREVEELAFGQRKNSQLLQELKRTEDPVNAHAILLGIGYWDWTVNPYPRRAGLPTEAPDIELPDLPDEPRRDLTHLPAFAIDDEDTQDPDDALSLEGDRLWVHIADVGALIPPNSPADLEARKRGSTIYLPEKVIPMLPRKVAKTLGLGIKEVSPALSFGLDFDSEGKVENLEIVPSWVRVQRFTYDEVEERIEEEPFQSFHKLGERFREQRKARGAVFIDLPEVKVSVKGEEVSVIPLPGEKSRDLIREAMLMVGDAVARLAVREGIPFLFANQDRQDFYTEVKIPPGLAGMYALRRTMRRSELKTIPGPHVGLGLNFYSQATSPLRRYADLVLHQQLRAYLRGGDLMDAQALVHRLGSVESVWSSIRYAERASEEHWTGVYLLKNPDWEGEGVVVGKRGARDTILIPELGLEIMKYHQGDFDLNDRVELYLKTVRLASLKFSIKIKEHQLEE